MIWRFILHDNNGDAYILSEEPKGWSDIVLKIKRDEQTHGVFFEFSETTLTFYGLPADLLEAGYQLYGIDNKVKLEVLMSCDGGMNYEDFYVGRCLFTKYKKECGDFCSVSIPVEQADEVMTFRNRLATKIDLDSTNALDGANITNYTYLNYLQTLPSKGIAKQLDWQKCESDVLPYPQPVATYDGLDCVVDSKVVPIGNPATTTDIYHTRYWTIGFDCMNRNEINTFCGAGDVVGDVNDVTPVLIVDEAGQFNLDFSIEGDIHAFAETSALELDWATHNPTGVYNFGYTQLSYNVHLVINGVDTILDSGTTTTKCGYSMTLPCSNVQTLVTSGVYFGGSAADDFYPADIYATEPIHFKATYTGTANLNVGDKVMLYVEVVQKGTYYHHPLFKKDITWGQSLIVSGNGVSYFKADVISYYPDTNTRAYYINEVFAKITEAITNRKMTVLSDYYGRLDSQPYQSTTGDDGCNSLLFLTNGLMVRNQNIQGNQPKMMLSFSEVFDAMNCIDNIGIGIEEDLVKADGSVLVRIEPVEYFYRTANVVLTCKNIDMVERELLENKYFSIVKFGYDKYEAEEYTGIDEFLTQREYTTKLQSVKNVDNRLCKFVASGYAIEVTRRKGNVDTKDWRFDNDTFVVCAYRAGDGQLYVEQGVNDASNIIDPPTIYNFRISPLRNAIRWCKTWMAGLKDWSVDVLKFSSGKGNFYAAGEYIPEGSYEATCISDDGGYAENQDISTALVVPDSVMKPLWKNEQIKFTYPLTYADYLAIKANTTGVIEFQCGGGATEKGHIMEITYKPNEGIADFTLLKTFE